MCVTEALGHLSSKPTQKSSNEKTNQPHNANNQTVTFHCCRDLFIQAKTVPVSGTSISYVHKSKRNGLDQAQPCQIMYFHILNKPNFKVS